MKYNVYELDLKTTNHHNCRKSALLSQLLIKNKLLSVLGTAGVAIDQGISMFVAANS